MKRNIRATIKKMLIGLFALVIVGYTLFNARLLIWGPQINDIDPVDGSVFESGLIKVSGTTRNITQISLNDRTIFIDESEKFEENILLSPGLNIIKLHGKDKFDREINHILNYVYATSASPEIFDIIPEFEVSTSMQDGETEAPDEESD